MKAASPGNSGGMRILHREYIDDIAPSNAFYKEDYDINPGLLQLTPWLANIATSYEEYKIHRMLFEYRPLCADSTISSSTSMGVGSVIMAVNYNPYNNPFVDKRTMENYDGAKSTKPSKSCVLGLNVKKIQTPLSSGPKWVRNLPVDASTGQDKRLYDSGTFSIAVQGQPTDATGVIGELWVAYDIEFFKPKYDGAIGSKLLYDHYVNLSSASGGNFVTNKPFGVNIPLSGKFLPNSYAGAGTYIGPKSAGDGLNSIFFAQEHIGMRFMVLMLYYSGSAFTYNDTYPKVLFKDADSLNVETASILANDVSDYWNTAMGNTPTHLQNSFTFAACCFLDIKSDPKGPWRATFNIDEGLMMANCYCEIFVTQVNGSDTAVPLFG